MPLELSHSHFRIIGASFVAVAVVWAVTGCADADSTGAEPRVTSGASDVYGARPAQAFGGDCDRLIAPDTVHQEFGDQVGPATSMDVRSFYAAAFFQAGALLCTWGDINSANHLSASVIGGSKSAMTTADIQCEPVSTETSQCSEVTAIGPYLVATSALGSDDGEARQRLQSITSELSASQSAMPEVPSRASEDGYWKDIDCNAIASRPGFDSAIPSTATLIYSRLQDAEFEDAVAQEVALESGVAGCTWDFTVHNEFASSTTVIFPGASWIHSDLLPVATAHADVPGADDAFIYLDPDTGVERLAVFDGPNYLTVELAEDVDEVAVAGAAIAALDSQL